MAIKESTANDVNYLKLFGSNKKTTLQSGDEILVRSYEEGGFTTFTFSRNGIPLVQKSSVVLLSKEVESHESEFLIPCALEKHTILSIVHTLLAVVCSVNIVFLYHHVKVRGGDFNSYTFKVE